MDIDILNKLLKSKSVVDSLIHTLSSNRRSGYTTKMLDVVNNTDNSLLICSVGDKQKISPRNSKLISINEIANGALMGKRNQSLFLDNHCLTDLLCNISDVYSSIRSDSFNLVESMQHELETLRLDNDKLKREKAQLSDEVEQLSNTINGIFNP